MVASAIESGRSKPPLSLWAYLSFAIAVTAFEVCRFAAVDVLAFTMPYTGWMFEFPYMWSIFFVMVALRGGKYGPAIKAVRVFLVLAIAVGVLDFVLFAWGEDYGNPYLRVSLWRPVFTILTPGLWLLLLKSEAVSSYCSGEIGPIASQNQG